jgi:hypothetical protein
MDLSLALNEFVYECQRVRTRLQSNEQESVTEVNLVMLHTQLFLLDTAAANLLELKRRQHKKPA